MILNPKSFRDERSETCFAVDCHGNAMSSSEGEQMSGRHVESIAIDHEGVLNVQQWILNALAMQHAVSLDGLVRDLHF